MTTIAERCRQNIGPAKRCPNAARYSFTWPGKERSFVCEEHKEKLLAAARVLEVEESLNLKPLD